MRWAVSAIFAILLLVADSSGAKNLSAVERLERFELWNWCKPMDVLIGELSEDAAAIDLIAEDIDNAVRSRLQEARLYSEDSVKGAYSFLHVKVTVFEIAVGISVEFRTVVRDLASAVETQATTWGVSSIGLHGLDSTYILSYVDSYTDLFVKKYLRVNASACER